MIRFATFVLIASIGGVVHAQTTDAAASRLDAVRASYAAFEKARTESRELARPLMAEFRKAERGSPEQRRLLDKVTEIRGMTRAPQKAFEAAFAGCAWQQLDVERDAELLVEGLRVVASDIEHPVKAVAAGKYFLDHFGHERLASAMRTRMLPNALLAAGKVDEATGLLETAAADAEGSGRARLQITLGDIAAASGDVEGAREYYAKAESNADDRTMGYVTLRKELIGKPAPDIDSSSWIGGDAVALSAMKGNVVLVDFWATWCGPCRRVMPGLNAMYGKHKSEGLRVIGVTRFYANGYMPADESQMVSGGETVRGMDETAFPAHVEAFRDNTGIDYPFVIADKSDFDSYHVRGIPTLAVVDRDGTIALVTVGAGSEPLLRYAVSALLAKK